MKYQCWLADAHGEDDGMELDADEACEAASDACEAWHYRGYWAGHPIPDPIEVHVRDLTTRKVVAVDVIPSYDVSFYHRDERPVPNPE